MATVARVRAGWSGFTGAPGLSTFYGLDGPTLATAVHDLFNAIKAYLPLNVTVQVESIGDLIETINGSLVGQWNTAALAVVTGTGTTIHAGPVGAMFRWETGIIADRHRVRGRTFLVPLNADSYDGQGALSVATQAGLALAASTFQTAVSGNLSVWHRPFKGAAATATKPARPSHVGGGFLVTGISVPRKAVVLRSRRD